MPRPSDYFKPDGIRSWIKACKFRNDREAADSLGVPFRTFGRYKARGLPSKNTANLTYSRVLIASMLKIAAERK